MKVSGDIVQPPAIETVTTIDSGDETENPADLSAVPEIFQGDILAGVSEPISEMKSPAGTTYILPSESVTGTEDSAQAEVTKTALEKRNIQSSW